MQTLRWRWCDYQEGKIMVKYYFNNQKSLVAIQCDKCLKSIIMDQKEFTLRKIEYTEKFYCTECVIKIDRENRKRALRQQGDWKPSIHDLYYDEESEG